MATATATAQNKFVVFIAVLTSLRFAVTRSRSPATPPRTPLASSRSHIRICLTYAFVLETRQVTVADTNRC